MKEFILLFTLFLIFNNQMNLQSEEIPENKKIKILASRSISTGLYSEFGGSVSEFCLKNGIEIISKSSSITYWNKNYYLFELPEDLDINQSPDIENIKNLPTFDNLNALDHNGYYLFSYPKLITILSMR